MVKILVVDVAFSTAMIIWCGTHSFLVVLAYMTGAFGGKASHESIEFLKWVVCYGTLCLGVVFVGLAAFLFMAKHLTELFRGERWE